VLKAKVMMDKTKENKDTEDRRSAGTSGEAKLRSKLISTELEQELLDVAGLSKADLYNRRGGLAERGLAALLEPGDKIVEILEDHVVIETKDGLRQSFWNYAKELPFLTFVGEGEQDTTVSSEDGERE